MTFPAKAETRPFHSLILAVWPLVPYAIARAPISHDRGSSSAGIVRGPAPADQMGGGSGGRVDWGRQPVAGPSSRKGFPTVDRGRFSATCARQTRGDGPGAFRIRVAIQSEPRPPSGSARLVRATGPKYRVEALAVKNRWGARAALAAALYVACAMMERHERRVRSKDTAIGDPRTKTEERWVDGRWRRSRRSRGRTCCP